MKQVRSHRDGIHRPYFEKKVTTHKISVLQVRYEDGSILHITNAFWEVGYPPTILVILEDQDVTFLHFTEDR